MRTTFEEKTYENYFNAELDRKSKIFFPLGQVQEGSLGFDASAYSESKRLWRWVGYPFASGASFKGADLQDIATEMEHYLGIEINDMPRMKANLLFQYKKPEYITTSIGSEWPHWNQPYFRYFIYNEQQDLLMQIHKKFKSALLVLYASPAAQNVNDLVAHKMNNEIIRNSNFTRAADLHGHGRNTYISAGRHSIACSEPTRIRSVDLISALEDIYTNDSRREDSIENNRDFITQFVNQVKSTTADNKYFSASFLSLNESLSSIDNYPLFSSFLTMTNFRSLTGIQWMVKI